MFKSFVSTRIETSKSQEEVDNLILDRLEDLGRTTLSPSGRFTISGTKFDGFGYTSNIEGRIKENDDSYTVNIDINIKPEVVAWLILICFFPIGALIMILPYNANTETESKVKNALEDLKYDIEKSKL